MKKVVITGATGFIGRYLCDELSKRGVEFYAVVRSESNGKDRLSSLPGAHIIECSLDKIESLPILLKEREFDAFFHLAWQGATGEERSNPSVQCDNVKWAEKCVCVAKELGCKRAVFTGTICEKQVDEILKREEFFPNSYYLLSKLQAKNIVETTGKKLGIKTVWCRFYHPIGVYNKKEQVICNTISKLLDNEVVSFGTGKEMFDVIDVRDLVEGMLLIFEKNYPKQECFIGSKCPRILKEYICELKSIVNPEGRVLFSESKNLPISLDKMDLIDKEFSDLTGFNVKYSFKDSILAMKDWLIKEETYLEK